MKTSTISLTATLLIASALHLEAMPTLAKPTYTITVLDSSSGNPYGGLTQAGDALYYSHSDKIQRFDLIEATNSVYATTASNTDTKGLAVIGSTMYLAMDTSYAVPVPSTLGTVDPETGFSPALQSGTEPGAALYSIYDAAVYNDEYYFVANPGTFKGANTGTRIYRYDTLNPTTPVEIANIGGYSGGIAFDTAGNLYYASQSWGEGILKFADADVVNGGLTAADGVCVANVTAGFIGFLPDGNLAATTGWGLSLDVFDINTGAKLRTIATAPSDWSEAIGKFVVAGPTLYVIHTDWNEYAGNLLALNLVEPAGYESWIAEKFPLAYPGDDADSDGDGCSNYAEFVAGTSPTNKNDALTIKIEMIAGAPSLSWTPNISGRSYTVQGRAALTAGRWATANPDSRFFRVKVELTK